MKLARWALPALLLITASAPFALADDKKIETKFTRFRDAKGSKPGRLEIAQASYTHPDTGVEVILYGVVHIADKAYYNAVQKDLSSYDVVLFEGVGPKKGEKVPEPDENMLAISEMQTMMGEMLGLTFQKDGIDYAGAKNFVHADMSYQELLDKTGGDLSKALPGGQMLDANMMKQIKPLLKMMKGMSSSLPKEMRDNFKGMMARQLAGADMSQLPGGEETTKILINERNKVALKVLDEQLATRKSGKIAIFYGAAHMHDFHDRLVDKGWTQTSVSWKAAWTIGGSAGDEEPSEPARPAPARPRRDLAPAGPKQRWF